MKRSVIGSGLILIVTLSPTLGTISAQTTSPDPIGIVIMPGADGGQNSIAIAVDASTKGKIKAYGSYTAAKDVKLTKVVVWAFPSGGGVMPAQTATTEIDDPVAGSWAGKSGCILDTRVYKNQYVIRADGFFSDNNNVSSGYVTAQVDGDLAGQAALSLSGIRTSL